MTLKLFVALTGMPLRLFVNTRLTPDGEGLVDHFDQVECVRTGTKKSAFYD